MVLPNQKGAIHKHQGRLRPICRQPLRSTQPAMLPSEHSAAATAATHQGEHLGQPVSTSREGRRKRCKLQSVVCLIQGPLETQKLLLLLGQQHIMVEC